MALQQVKEYFSMFGRTDVLEFSESSATVAQAAEAIGVQEDAIAKTLSFLDASKTHAILIVTSGNTRIKNGKFKRIFGFKPHMIPSEQVEALTGHPVGGVCPFANPQGTQVYLDESLKKHAVVYPACGSVNSAIRLTLGELERYAHPIGWVDIAQDSE